MTSIQRQEHTHTHTSDEVHCRTCQCREKEVTAFRWLDRTYQILGILAAIAFGLFGVLAWKVGVEANKEARVANQMAVINYCDSVSVRFVFNLVADSINLLFVEYTSAFILSTSVQGCRNTSTTMGLCLLRLCGSNRCVAD